ncbi:MAG: relaxase/mobilization nuclease domain-containing protein [Lachnospiraceae bacterium]|nr:relaxase/mobilization nuclease domain-containing protein [Lachnospiraceae bacterium]
MSMYLANAISYITDGEKAGETFWWGNHNCNAGTALQEMLTTKRKYGKRGKRQGCHLIIFFKKQEVRSEAIMEVVQKFEECFFRDNRR